LLVPTPRDCIDDRSKTAIHDATRKGATIHEVREFAGDADIRMAEVDFVREAVARTRPDCGPSLRRIP
jgi:hypothetical protein